jgi:hypothetical protein
MKIIITEEQFYNLIPQSIRRRMTERDFEILDDIIHTNKKYDLNNPFDKYLDINLRDSLNQFITEYKVGKLDPNLDDNDWEREESLMYKIFWQLIPFVKKKYYNELYEYYMENHRRRGSMNESNEYQNKLRHLYRRIGEIEDVFKEHEDLFARTTKTLNKDGFIHAVGMFIGDIIAGRIEEKDIDFDYVTFRNQIKRFVETHFYDELIDFYNTHKKSLTESQDEKLFKELPISIRRRLEPDDLDYIDGELTHYILSTPPTSRFEDFSSSVIGDVLHEFIIGYKGDEIEIEDDPEYGEVYNEESRNKVMDRYWVLKPFLEKKYKDRLYRAWERKKLI